MFFVEILRFFTGYIKIRGIGGFGERFINLCSVYDISLWNITYYNNYFEACTTIDGYFKIPPCARSSGVKIKRIQSVGLPFIIQQLKPRVGLLIGLAFFVLCFSMLSGKVWIVNITGNNSVPTDVILEATQKAGLKHGIDIKSINPVQLSLDTCKEVDELAWAAVSINGCCVHIDVSESDATREIESKDGIYNLVASRDAQIIVLECYRGTQQAKLFSSVMKGDILISGTADNKDETTSFVRASGYAVGKTETSISTSVSTSINTTQFIPIKKAVTLNFFNLSIDFSKAPKKFDRVFTHVKSLSADGKILPVSIRTEQYYSSKQKSKAVSNETAELIALSDFLNEASQFSEGKQIISSKLEIKNESEVTVTGKFVCYENIGRLSPLETDFEH